MKINEVPIEESIQFIIYTNYWQNLFEMIRIQALILSEFNDAKGFTIIHVAPSSSLITEKQFSLYSQLILHRQEFCGKLLVVEFMEKYYLVGVPLISKSINDSFVYHRAKYIYSVNILVSKMAYLNPKLQPMYKQIAKKLGHFFKFIQETTHFIYNNKQYLAYLTKILDKCFRDINQKSECVINHLASCYTILSFRRPPHFQQNLVQQSITDILVPITFLTSKEIQEEIQNEFCQGLLHIARIGDYNISKIIGLMGHRKLVQKFYRKAIEMGLVIMVDMFCIYNRYCLTPKIHEYLPQKNEYYVLKEICTAVSLKKQNKFHEKQQRQKLLTPNELLLLLFQFQRTMTLKKIIDQNLQIVSKMNFVKFIRISCILGIIKKIHERLAFSSEQFSYIECIGEDQQQFLREKEAEKEEGEEKNRRIQLVNHIKNMRTIEEICVAMKMNRIEVYKLVKAIGKDKIKILYTHQ